MDYQEFLRSKQVRATPVGFDVELSALRPCLFDYQRAIVRWALRLGRAAIFAECGLGKTLMQLEWADRVAEHTGRPVLILTPLAVAKQTLAEAERFGYGDWTRVVGCQDDVKATDPAIAITNYQKLHHFDPAAFAGVVLDESSILKSYAGKTKKVLLDLFQATLFRLACTATPAPNDHMELGNHAEFLGIMKSGEMLTRWFINDLSEAGVYRLKGHAEKDFWRWVSSWAVCLTKPSDLGFADAGHELPPLHIRELVTETDQTVNADGLLFRLPGMSATTMHQEMRLTCSSRAGAVADLVNGDKQPWVVWCNTNYEADALCKLIPDAVDVRGSDPDLVKEDRLTGFSSGKYRVIVTKPTIAGFGLNWQHCSRMAFVGLSYSFEQQYQAIRRVWRFGQKSPVECTIVYADTEGAVAEVVKRKMEEFGVMQKEMVKATEENVLQAAVRRELVSYPRRTESGIGWTMHQGDCVEVVREFQADSIGFSVFSPPFGNLYIYSDSEADMGNAADDDEFFEHFGYLVPELLRVTIPGRLCAVHCKDLPLYKNRDGAAGLRDFPGRIIRLFEEHGWTYHSRVTIWKCPVTEMQRTKNQGLLYKQLKQDSCYSRMGMADYVVVFRKWTDCEAWPAPVEHRPEDFPVDRWQEWASPVWMDVQNMNVLNVRQARDGSDEKHICPLQLDVIERCVTLWSNPGDAVLSPFAGIASEGYVSRKLGRQFVGVELKPSYFDVACRNLRMAEMEANQTNLFERAA